MKVPRNIIILVLLLLFYNICLSQEDLHSKRISLHYSNTSLSDIISGIENTYQIHFFYCKDCIPLDIKTSINVKNQLLDDICQMLFKENDIDYQINDTYIALKKGVSLNKLNISGKVFDVETKRAIPFVNISITNSNKGTSTNEEGTFKLSLSSLPESIIISHLGYKSKISRITKDTSLVIFLKPTTISLEEIEVEPVDPQTLVLNAYRKLRKLSDKKYYGKAYYRQKTSNNKVYSELIETFYEVEFTRLGLSDWHIINGRYALRNDININNYIANLNFSWLIKNFKLLPSAKSNYIMPLTSTVNDYYTLSLAGYINYKDRNIAMIRFKSKFNSETPVMQGIIYIDKNNYDVLKIKGEIEHPLLKLISFTNTNSRWDNYLIDFETAFIPANDSLLLLDYIKVSHSFEHIKENHFNRKVITSSFLTFYEHYAHSEYSSSSFRNAKAKSDYELVNSILYDEDFWRDNSAVQRTPIEEEVILSFKESGIIGTVSDIEKLFAESTINYENNLSEDILEDYTLDSRNLYSSNLVDISTISSNIESLEDNYQKSPSSNQSIINSVVINDNVYTISRPKYVSIIGHPYLYEDWKKGEIVMNSGSRIENLDIKYNSCRGLLYIKDSLNNIYRLNNNMVSQFIVNENNGASSIYKKEQYQSKRHNERPYKYYKLLYDGFYSLYVLQEKHFKKATYKGEGYDMGTRYDEYIELPDRYYLKRNNGTPVKFRLTGKSFLNHLTTNDDERKVIKEYMNMNHIRIKNIPDIIKVIKYYEVRTMNY